MTVTKERWRELCKQAAKEKDPNKFVKLCDEINSILRKAEETAEQSRSTADLPPAGSREN